MPSGYEAFEEFPLSSLPRRIDIVIIKRRGQPRGEVRGLSAIMGRLNEYNLIEVKGPTDSLAWSDLIRLLGYTLQLMLLEQERKPGAFTQFTLSDGIPESFRAQVAALCSTIGEGKENNDVQGFWHHENDDLTTQFSPMMNDTSIARKSGGTSRTGYWSGPGACRMRRFFARIESVTPS